MFKIVNMLCIKTFILFSIDDNIYNVFSMKIITNTKHNIKIKFNYVECHDIKNGNILRITTQLRIFSKNVYVT